MATVVHDGDVSAGYQVFKCEAQSRRTSPCDEQGRYRWIGGARCWGECMDGADSVMLPKVVEAVVIIKRDRGLQPHCWSFREYGETSKFGYDIGAGTELLVFCGD